MEKYIPDMYQKSIYDVSYEKLMVRGVKCLLFDLDNTLAPFSAKSVDDKVKTLFNNLREMGFKVIIFSNSPKSRVSAFAESLAVDFVANAKKPLKMGFNAILNKYKYNITEVAIIGDQMLTDICGGNKIGITTILVNPISTTDPIWTKFNRHFEHRVMNKLTAHDLFFKGRYYD